MKKTSIDKQYQKSIKKVEQITKDKVNKDLFEHLLYGRNDYLRYSRKGSSKFDPSWIDIIEDCLYDLGEIVNNPREVTKEEGYITPIELAKKVNGESVMHLASHTQFIKEVSEKGEVTPSKILSHSNIEDLHTYENKFIATFIRRLLLFIEKRYEYISKVVDLTREDVLIMRNKTTIDGKEVEIETKVKVKQDEDDVESSSAKDYIARIKVLREYVSYYYNSKFMKEMKTDKDVRTPILQTNIIRKNPKYHKCYETFLFIERFDALGVSYNVSEKYQEFTDKEIEELNYINLLNLLSIRDDKEFDSIKEITKQYKPRILKSIDDEEFIYNGNKYKGPIEFVRVDDEFREYLRRHVRMAPSHPTKFEKEFYFDDYKYKREEKEFSKELEELIKRKQADASNYEKLVEEILEERKQEILREQKEYEAMIRKQEKELIEAKRKEIIDNALNSEAYKYEGAEKHQIKKISNSNEDILENIPGRYIVKTPQGYYVDDEKFTKAKTRAYIFRDFNSANHTKKRYGGKVIKI